MVRASQVASATTFIRFIGYKPAPGVKEEQFIEAWRATVEQAPQPVGMLYRELCQQVPEWNAQIVDEAQHPNPFVFVDYTIYEPALDPSQLPSLSTDIAAQYEKTEGLFTIEHPFIKSEPAGEPEAILINCFEINGPPAVEQGFVLGWPARGDYQSQQEGFFSALLHHRIQPDVRIAAFNRAEWRNIAAYVDTLADFDRHFPRAARAQDSGQGKPPVSSYLGMYRIVMAFQGPASPPKPPMKAVVMHGYGGPEVLKYEDVPRPAPGPGQILLRVHAVSLNHLDTKMRSGEVKTIHPLWPRDILGYDLAGIIEAIGPGVTARHVGEEVYGTDSPSVRRGYAEYVTAPAQFFQPKPTNLSFVQAAATPSVALTAYNALFAMANLQSGQTVLIHGGSGAVGAFAIQFAKQAGAHVITTTSTARLDYVRSLGADVVIDYKTRRFEEVVSDVDVVLDSLGGVTREHSWDVLRRGGVLVTLVPPLPDPAQAAARGVRAMMNQNVVKAGDLLDRITTMIETGQLRPAQVGLTLPLKEAQQAHVLLEQGTVQGRIVLEVE